MGKVSELRGCVTWLRKGYGENRGASQGVGDSKSLILLCYVRNARGMLRGYAVLGESIYPAPAEGGRFRANFFIFWRLTVRRAVCWRLNSQKQRYT